MRLVLLIAVLFILSASFAFADEEINTTKYVQGDNFTLDNSFFYIYATYTNGSVIKMDDQGFILNKDDCLDTNIYSLCVDSTTNNSVSITFFRYDKFVNFTRDMPSSLSVDNSTEITITLTNGYDNPQEISFIEKTNLTVISQEGFTDDLVFEGTISGHSSKKISYFVKAPHSGDYFINGSLTGINNFSSNKTIKVTDTITVKFSYKNNITKNKQYNYSVDITSDSAANISMNISVPKGIIVNRSSIGSDLFAKVLVNKTYSFSFLYYADRFVDDNISFFLSTENNDSETIMRTYNNPINTNSFITPLIIHDADNIIVDEKNTSIPYQIINRNYDKLAGDIIIESFLYNETKKITIPANSNYNSTISISPKSGNSYLIRLNFTFSDPNGDSISITRPMRVSAPKKSAVKQNITNTTTNNSVNNTVKPSISIQSDSDDIIITYSNTPDGFAYMILKFNDTIISNDSVIINNSGSFSIKSRGSGKYEVTLSISDITLSAEHSISPQVISLEQEEMLTDSSTNNKIKNYTWLIYLAVLLAGLGATLKIRASRIKKHKEQEEEYLLLLESFIPRNEQEAYLKNELIKKTRKR